jgi:putative transposase
MARPLLPLTLTVELQDILQAITRSREVPHSLVQRAQLVLAANSGCNNKTISQNLGLCGDTIGFWRKRWLANRVELKKFEGKPKPLREAVS